MFTGGGASVMLEPELTNAATGITKETKRWKDVC